MTGATSGLGFEAAKEMIAKGHHLVALCRDPKKGDKLKSAASENQSGGSVHLVPGDLGSFETIAHACKAISEHVDHIDQLILNAGIMNFWRRKTSDNIEETLQVNLLSHILMVELLKDKMRASNQPRIVMTSSALHQGEIQFDNLEFKKGFSAFKVYRQSKLGVILCVKHLHEQLKEEGVLVVAHHPGLVRTNLGRSAGIFSKLVFLAIGMSASKGAETLVFLSESDRSELKGGEYYAFLKPRKTSEESYDLEVAQRLYRTCLSYIQDYT